MVTNKVYICSPLRADNEKKLFLNMKRAEYKKDFTEVYLKNKFPKQEWRALAPHAYIPKMLDDNIEEERKLGINFGLEILKLCNYIAIFTGPDKIITQGMGNEITCGSKENKTFLCFTKDSYMALISYLKANNLNNANVVTFFK